MWIFQPIFKPTIWGGQRIPKLMGFTPGNEPVGESWCMSVVEGSESVVADGPDKGLTLPQLIDKYGADLLGREIYMRYGRNFPILLKLIDAQDHLSVQVHPDDAMARRYGMPYGKTEMWYVMDAAPGARLANGFNSDVDSAVYDRLVHSGEIEGKLKFIDIRKGDAFFIPAGNVHTIGKGALIAEIQQSSDATYRIYDYHRKDKNGNERELHTDLAKEALNFSEETGDRIIGKATAEGVVNLTESEYFTTNLLTVAKPMTRDYSNIDSFVALLLTEGEVVISTETSVSTATLRPGSPDPIITTRTLRPGQAVLLPATSLTARLTPSSRATLLETYL